MLIISQSTLYIIHGIAVVNGDHSNVVRAIDDDFMNMTVKNQKAIPGRRMFEWLFDQAESTGNRYPVCCFGNSLTIQLPNIDLIDEKLVKSWAETIWKEFLSIEGSFRGISLSEVHSVFKRRHHLKYTALEVTDTRGIPVLFSCANQDVRRTTNVLPS